MTSPSPFSPRAALVVIAGGAVLLLALLGMIGMGLGKEDTNNGGGHGAGRGLNGFAALAAIARADGATVVLARDATALARPGLLVLTPPADSSGEDIAQIVAARRAIGPTLVILPKWQAAPADRDNPQAKPGWTTLVGVQPPNWPGFLDEIGITVHAMPAGHGQWTRAGGQGQLPAPDQVMSGQVISGPRPNGHGAGLVPLVVGARDGRVLAGYLDDSARNTALAQMAQGPRTKLRASATAYPLIVVFEPDLLNNFGMARPEQAALAQALLQTSLAGGPKAIAFDLTLNGLARAPNLAALALTPPYLAATLCLLLAAVAVGWRSLARFGPPLMEDPDLALGKAALVANSAALIRRARRLGLMPVPAVDATRERLARALGLSRRLGPQAIDAAIDRALASRTGQANAFAQTAQKLLDARGQSDLVHAAQDLHTLERKLTK